MTKPFRPMLASPAPDDLSKLKMPLMASPKLDGIRCLIRDGMAVSRNLKPIPNKFIQSKLQGLPEGLDGELIVGECCGEGVMNRTASGVMSEDGEPLFNYWVFDKVGPRPYQARFQEAFLDIREWWTKGEDHVLVKPLPQQIVANVEHLKEFEEQCVTQGYEGIMIRSLDGPYKQGRSTAREGYLLKVKRFEDSEAEIIGKKERRHNANEATKDALGHTRRSGHKANMQLTDTLGAFECRWPNGVEFDVGTGFDDETRKKFWVDPEIIGKLVKFKYQELTPDGVPRFPVYIGIRHPNDL
jgi:DNA ligase-1